MDFSTLSRRELQALCKKNKIPANMTNVAMIDALNSLDFVDGMDELLKPCESETANSYMESPGKSETVTSVPRTSRRATQQRTTKHDPEALLTSTRSRCRTRGTVAKDVDEAGNQMLETPALPATRRRAAATSVRPKLETLMKECEQQEKDVPKTPAAALTSRKAQSSVRQVYSTRRSARLAVKPMQESSTQENEMSGTISFDVLSEETDGGVEVDSEQYSVHKDEELANNGIDLITTFENLEINKISELVSGQDSNVVAESEINMEAVVEGESGDNFAPDTKAEKDSVAEEIENNNGSEDVNTSEMKVLENEKELDSGEVASEGLQSLNDVSEAKTEVFGEEESIIESEVDHAEAKDDTSDFVAGNEVEEEDQLNKIDVAGKEEPIEEPMLMEESDVYHTEANVDTAAHAALEKVSENEQCLEDVSEAYVMEVAGEETMEESEIDHAEANESANEQCLEDISEACVMEVAGEEEHMEESEVDHAEVNVESAVKKSSAVTNIGPIPFTDDKENICNTGSKSVLTKEELQKMSLRQLTKMLKDCKITKGDGEEISKIKGPSSRSALQILPEN